MRRNVRAFIGSLTFAALAMIWAATPIAAAQTIVSLTFDDAYDDAPLAAQIMGQYGMKGTFYIISGVLGTGSPYMTVSQVQALQAAGHEIAGHTISHPHLTTLTQAQAQNEICGGRTQLINMGFQPVTNFACPFGDSNSTIESIVASCYVSGRGAWELGCNYSGCSPAESIPPVDPYWIRTPDAVVYTTTLAQLEAQVTTAENAGGGWVPMQFHHVCDGCDGTDSNAYSVSPANLTAFLSWLQARASQGTVVQTVSQVMSTVPPPPPPPPPSAYSIWGASSPAAGNSSSDATNYNLGVRWRADVNGTVIGLRYYRWSANTGTHVGDLWSNSGTKLAEAAFTGGTASGWQTVFFSTPVPITAGATYVASYWTNTGFAVTTNYFVKAIDNAPLHALAYSTGSLNGLYGVSATQLTMPASSTNKSNYWVDVLFTVPSSSGPTPNPVPSLTSITPSSATSGASAFTLTLTGTNFISGSIVQWNGSPRTTSVVNATTLTASIPASDLVSAGTAMVSVINPAPGGGTSSSQNFMINAPAPPPNPVPLLTSIIPSAATMGGAGFTLTLNGNNFVSTSTVRWNGVTKVTTFISSTSLTAAIPASDIASSGTFPVTVFTPSPGGGTSGPQLFTVSAATQTLNPMPVMSSLSPSSATAGGSAFTLTINGSNFIGSSTVQWNGGARTTTFVNGTKLTAAIPASDVVSSGTASVTVINPAPGGGTSASQPFTIGTTPPPPPPPPPSGPWTIWGSSAPKSGDGWKDPSPLEVGVRFRSDVNAYVKGIRFYKWSTNTGAHTGNLWSNTGTLLATVTFTGETATGWQTAYFSNPVAITANTTYVASYFTTTGYAVTTSFFIAGVDNAPLHALASGVDGLNGLYKYNATSAFPTQSTKSSNYWVDVVLNTTATFGANISIPPTSGVIVPAFTDFSQVREYPNPWRVDRFNNGHITFDQMPLNSTVRIFTVSAHWVTTLEAPAGSVTWDLTNSAGEAVASGYYIYLMNSPSAEKKHGTLAIIR